MDWLIEANSLYHVSLFLACTPSCNETLPRNLATELVWGEFFFHFEVASGNIVYHDGEEAPWKVMSPCA